MRLVVMKDSESNLWHVIDLETMTIIEGGYYERESACQTLEAIQTNPRRWAVVHGGTVG